MGHSTLITEAMKVTLVLSASLALCLVLESWTQLAASGRVFACQRKEAQLVQMELNVQLCAPPGCGLDMMTCPVMVNGCAAPDECLPMKGGPVGNDGVECPVMCPSALHPCGADMIACPVMGANGCQQPDTCL